MYLVYQPEGSEEPKRWKYQPTKLMSAEREKLEKLTSRNFSQFTRDVVEGNSLCRRALLFLYLKREHPPTRWEDVDFAWDELTLQFSKGELRAMRDEVSEKLTGADREASLAQLDAEIEDAFEEPDEGKALLPIAG
jgi:hypothetical protein